MKHLHKFNGYIKESQFEEETDDMIQGESDEMIGGDSTQQKGPGMGLMTTGNGSFEYLIKEIKKRYPQVKIEKEKRPGGKTHIVLDLKRKQGGNVTFKIFQDLKIQVICKDSIASSIEDLLTSSIENTEVEPMSGVGSGMVIFLVTFRNKNVNMNNLLKSLMNIFEEVEKGYYSKFKNPFPTSKPKRGPFNVLPPSVR